jgi:DNA-binding Lrp family transcriptional regulator
MSKNSKDQIDQDEKKIISELVKNSKENIDTIAKHCGFSAQKVRRVIKQMEQNHVIWGYTSVFDEKRIGLKHFIMMAKRTPGQVEEKTVDKIIQRELEDRAAELGITIESSAYVHGDYDWIITFTAEDIVQAKMLSNSLNLLHPNKIEKVAIIQTLMFIKKQYILNPDREILKDFL